MIRNYRVEPVARKIPSRKEIFTRETRASDAAAVGGQSWFTSISTAWKMYKTWFVKCITSFYTCLGVGSLLVGLDALIVIQK